MILITGAAGKTGRAVLRALAPRGLPIRALVRRESQSGTVRELGASEVLRGDLRDGVTQRRACRGVEAIYHICPNVSPEELSIGQGMIAAAGAAGVSRFVYHSVLHPQTRAMPHHWRKLQVEEELLASGLSFTILRPAAYMQNLRASWRRVVEEGVYPVPYALAARIALVDLADIAEVAGQVLTESGHEHAIYDLCSGEAPRQEEIAAQLGAVLGRPVQAIEWARREWEEQARAAGLGREPRQTLLAMFRYYERSGLPGNGQVLRWLLGRPATTLREYLERVSGRSPTSLEGATGNTRSL